MRQFGEYLLLLVIVMLLLGVISIRIPGPHRSTEARRLTAYADVNGGLKTALNIFKVNCGRYPTQTEGLKVLIAPPSDGSLTKWRGPYIDSARVPKDPWGHEYIYRFPSVRGTNDYDLYSMGPDGVDKTPDDIGDWM